MCGAIVSAVIAVVSWQSSDGPRQPPDLRCGAYCTYSVLKGLDLPVPTFDAFERQLGQPGMHGYSLQQLCDIAIRFGASARCVESDLASLYGVPRPFGCVALLKGGHFVGIYDADADQVFLIDPPDSYAMRRGLFEELWTGNALLIFAREAPELSKPSRLRSSLLLGVFGSVATVLLGGFIILRRFASRAPR